MARSRIRLTEAEFAVLEPLWQAGPQTIRQLMAQLYPEQSTSDYATVQKLLERLESKRCVKRDRAAAAHVFRAIVQREDLIDEQLRQIADGKSDKNQPQVDCCSQRRIAEHKHTPQDCKYREIRN